MKMSLEDVLQSLDPEIRRVLNKIPRFEPDNLHSRLSPDWLHCQIIERFKVLKYAEVVEGSNVLEVGCGPQAIATVALALLVGDAGRVVALDRGRWDSFWKIMEQVGLPSRVIPFQGDARELPFPFPCFDLVACIHGFRSFDNRETVINAVREMLRVTKDKVFFAESSPIARNKAQEAHLAMYNLRRPTFLALDHEDWGDIPYFTPKEMEKIVKEAGAAKVDVKLVDVNMPHHLAYFPLETIEKIQDEETRYSLKERWMKALDMLERYGEEHPPVVMVNAWKMAS